MQRTRTALGTLAGLGTVVAMAPHAAAQQVLTRATLELLLADRIVSEDFEGVSVHGGSGVELPNPLNNDTVPAWWNGGIQDGVTYSTDGTLRLFGGFSNGDDDNFFHSTSDLLIVFDQPQAAVGFYNAGSSSQQNRTDTITFLNGTDAIASLEVQFANGGGFIGWQHAAGITSVLIEFPHTQNSIAVIDDLTWGFEIAPCPADIAAPEGVLDLADINRFIEQFVDHDDLADLTPPSGVYDLADISAFVDSFMAGCP